MNFADLLARYRIDRSQLRTRIRFLSLKSGANLERISFNCQEIFLLDDLHAHLQLKGKLSNYTPPSVDDFSNSGEDSLHSLDKLYSVAIDNRTQLPTNRFSCQRERSNSWESHLSPSPTLHKEIEEHFPLNQCHKYNGILEELANRGWELTTREIREIAGIKPENNYDKYGCFLFVKQGMKGNKTTWRIIKQPRENISSSDRQKIINARRDFYRDFIDI